MAPRQARIDPPGCGGPLVLYLERRVIAIEKWAREQGYEPPDFTQCHEDDG